MMDPSWILMLLVLFGNVSGRFGPLRRGDARRSIALSVVAAASRRGCTRRTRRSKGFRSVQVLFKLSGGMVELYIQTVKQDMECLGASQKVHLYIWVSQKLGGTWRDSECETAQDNNQLWIGRGGSLTPCHYDKAENLHMQICGQKTFLLIPPDQTFAPGLQLQKLLLKIACNFVCPDELKSFGCFLRPCTLILLIILWTLSPWWILMRRICNDSRQDHELCEVVSVNVSFSVNTDDWFEDLTALLIWSLLK